MSNGPFTGGIASLRYPRVYVVRTLESATRLGLVYELHPLFVLTVSLHGSRRT